MPPKIFFRMSCEANPTAIPTEAVAAMIEGLLRHCTDADIDTNYVDTHGASVVGFAFTELLGFRLLPRLKNIGAIRLYRPDDATIYTPQLGPVLTRPIRWELIIQQYDQMVRYATALRLGTAESESILRRFTRGGPKHPGVRAEHGAVERVGVGPAAQPGPPGVRELARQRV